jgi:hypothetical protein
LGVEVKESYIKQFDISNSLHSFRINTSKEQFLDKLLIFIKVVVEYALGTHIGYALGWVIGLYVGHSYVEHFEPVYLDDLSQLSGLLSHWRTAPYIFARNGAVIGVAAGMIAIALIHNKSHKECKSDEHTKHLCHFVSYGYHVNNEDNYKDLVKEPRYKCNFCGCTANLEESLCNPAKL